MSAPHRTFPGVADEPRELANTGEHPSVPIVKPTIYVPASAILALKRTHPIFQRLVDNPRATMAINCIGLEEIIPVLPESRYHLVLLYKTSNRVFAIIPQHEVAYILFRVRSGVIVCITADVGIISNASHFRAIAMGAPEIITGAQLLEMLTLPQTVGWQQRGELNE